eukprot:CAMPEP_0117666876 /NCGR_PEP_ID=MMETSP0804-20121206/10630_1 /TAXON_ID=1074897 /ORGANISM="Tetraselmis astigmatica, Strain CCMP880" /LENGTH=518 /DNA_ID=CAMNT_0005474491 /DNA_START=366 /DNA_END=1922 /DNA_ORIENTATION=-
MALVGILILCVAHSRSRTTSSPHLSEGGPATSLGEEAHDAKDFPEEEQGQGNATKAAVMTAQVKAEGALLFRTKQMSQAQLDAAVNLIGRSRKVASALSMSSDDESATSMRRPSSCLGGTTFHSPGNLYVKNTGGMYSSWIKKLGGQDDPRYVHMAMVERLGNGSIVAMWQQSMLPIEGTEQQMIYYKVSADDTPSEWYPEQRLQVSHSGALWSPVLHFEDGVLYVLYSESRDCIRSATANAPPRWFPGGDVKMTKTEDLLTWEKPTVVYSQDQDNGVPKVLANKLVVRSNGEWVLPFWREIPRGGKALTKGKCVTGAMRASAGVLVSTDKGDRWRALGEITHPLTWLIENSVVELDHDKALLMLFRTWAGRIFQARSSDGGRSWGLPTPLSLPNPDAKIHVIRLQGSSDLLLAFNDHQKHAEDGFTRFRTGLRLAISHDNGASWARVAQVDEIDEPGWQFHYPTLMQHGCNISVAYSRTYTHSNEDDLDKRSQGDDNQRPGIRILTFNISQLLAGLK